ncbi:hypothetical protein KGV52_00605 [Candidatus Gracilibacteria bacterium]|nr:hypothetical protein [Candidatus Gracilibacteria bacterium]
MKKIFAYILLMSLLLGNTALVNAQTVENISDTKTVIFTEGNTLNSTVQGQKYKKAIDRFIENASTEKLANIQQRTSAILAKKSYTGLIASILKYIDAKATVKLAETKNTVKKQFAPLSEQEKIATHKAIIALQKNIFNTIGEVTKQVETSFKQQTNFSENGAFEMNVEAQHEALGFLKYKIDADQYEQHQNGFDSIGKTGDVNVLVNFKAPEIQETKLELVTNFETIQKDGNAFFLLKKFNIIDEKGMEDAQDFFKKAKELVAENKYISISDPKQEQIFKMLKHLTADEFMKQFSALNDTKMFDVVGKENNKFVIQPNKELCLFVKNIQNDTYIDCEEAFQNDVAELNQAGTMYLEVLKNDNYKISFSGKDESNTKIDFSASYTTDELKNITFTVVPNINNAGLIFEYTKNDNITFKFQDPQAGKIDFLANLDGKNHINTANLNVKVSELTLTGKYENNHLSIQANSDSQYVNATAKVELDFYKGIPTDGNINIKVNNKDFSTGEKRTAFESNINFKNKNISGTTKIPGIVNIKHSGNVDKNIFNLENDIQFGVFANLLYAPYNRNSENINLTAKLKLNIDTTDNNNNILVDGKLFNNDENVITIFFKNISKREYNTSVKIQKPERVIDMEEFISDFYSY